MITELSFEIYGKREFKYLLNLIDHFSKYACSFLLKDKKANTVLFCIKECFKKIGIPKQLGTDNGSEFSNNKMKNYLDENKIKFIHGSAYNPRSQGAIERLHRTIKNSLLCRKIDKGNKFDLEYELNFIINNYNNTIHETTQFTPNELFYSSSEKLFEEAYNNTINSFCYINARDTNFQLNEKVFLFNNFIIDKKRSKKEIKYLIKNKVKNKKTFF